MFWRSGLAHANLSQAKLKYYVSLIGTIASIATMTLGGYMSWCRSKAEDFYLAEGDLNSGREKNLQRLLEKVPATAAERNYQILAVILKTRFVEVDHDLALSGQL